MPAPVDPLIPLSLLEAVRTVDLPDNDLEAEFVHELRNKRLGLSDTVFAQIKRFSEAVRRKQRVGFEEAQGIARLIGRRPDAEAVFREAGRFFARQVYGTISPVTRKLLRTLPALLTRPMAMRQVRRMANRHLTGTVRRVGGMIMLDVDESVTRDAAAKLGGCSFYESALREFIQLMLGGVGAVDHVRCASRSEGRCEWRAEWRPVRGKG
jgi:predicted hydrocarbon binding protein